MTLLQILQQVALRSGLPRPVVGVSSQSPQTQQMIGLLTEEIEEVIARTKSQRVRTEASFVTNGSEDQGALTTLCGNQVPERIINNTLWNGSDLFAMWGPLGAPEWAQAAYWVGSSPRGWYRIINNHLFIRPALSAGITVTFEFVRAFGILSKDGVTIQQGFVDDLDTILFPDALMIAGLRWRWKREKGLTYAEDKLRYEGLLAEFMNSDGTRTNVDLAAHPKRKWPWDSSGAPVLSGTIGGVGDSNTVLIVEP